MAEKTIPYLLVKQTGPRFISLGQLSLAIPSWVGAMSTSESWDINGHTAISMVSPQCKLVSG